MARSATPRGPADCRTGRLDRPGRRHVPLDLGTSPAPGSGHVADGPPLPATAVYPVKEEPTAVVTPDSFWALLPAADRERFGLRLSRLVLKAVRPPAPHFEEEV
jgi:hypothetical protein